MHLMSWESGWLVAHVTSSGVADAQPPSALCETQARRAHVRGGAPWPVFGSSASMFPRRAPCWTSHRGRRWRARARVHISDGLQLVASERDGSGVAAPRLGTKAAPSTSGSRLLRTWSGVRGMGFCIASPCKGEPWSPSCATRPALRVARDAVEAMILCECPPQAPCEGRYGSSLAWQRLHSAF